MNLGQVPFEQRKPVTLPRMLPAQRSDPGSGCLRLASNPVYPPRLQEVSDYDAKHTEIANQYPMAGRLGYEPQTAAFKSEMKTLDEGPLGIAWHQYYADVDAAEKAEHVRITGLVESSKSRGWTVTPHTLYEGGPVVSWEICPPKSESGAPAQVPAAAEAPKGSSTPLIVGGGIAAAGAAALLLAGRRSAWLGQVPLRSPNS